MSDDSAALQKTLSDIQQFADGIDQILMATDPEGNVTWVNDAFTRTTGYETSDVLGKKPGELLQGRATDPDTITLMRDNLASKTPFSCDILNYRKDGSEYWVRLSVTPLFNDAGELTGYAALQTDVSSYHQLAEQMKNHWSELELAHEQLEQQAAYLADLAEDKEDARQALADEVERRKQLEAELTALAETDALTGLANRRKFFETGASEVKRAARYGTPLSIITYDIDHFKRVNDTYGHSAGDQVIIEVSNRSQGALRKTLDIVGRLGGEEFAVLLPNTPVEGAIQFAERLKQRFSSAPVRTEKGALTVTCSFGVAEWRPQDRDINATLNRADQALYRSKEAGRNCISVASRALSNPDSSAAG